MSPDQVRARTLELIQEQTTDLPDYRDGETLGARNFDSLEVVELQIAIDDEFKVDLPDVDWGYDTTVEQVLVDTVRFVCGHQS